MPSIQASVDVEYLLSYKASDTDKWVKRIFKPDCKGSTSMTIDKIVENTTFSFKWQKIISGTVVEDSDELPDFQLSDSTGILSLNASSGQNHKHILIEINETQKQAAPVIVSSSSKKRQNLIKVKHATEYMIRISTADSSKLLHSGLPKYPEKPKVRRATSSYISIEWNKQENVAYYEVSCHTPSSGLVESFKTSDNWYNFKNLSPKTQYTFGIQAVNSYGSSEKIFVEGNTTDVTLASPRSLRISLVSTNSVTLQWEAPERFADAVEYYSIRYKCAATQTDDEWIYVDATIHDVFYKVQDLSDDTEYVFQVSAHFDGDLRIISEKARLSIKTKRHLATPGKPIYETMVNGDIRISWATNDEELAVQKYELFLNKESERYARVHSTSNNSFLICKASFAVIEHSRFLPAEENYVFQVRAVGDTDNYYSDYSECSEFFSLRTLPQVPGKPKAIACTATSIHLTWNAAKPCFQGIRYTVAYITAESNKTCSIKNWKKGKETNTESVVVENLMPYTSYFLKVQPMVMVKENLKTNKICGLDGELSDPIQTAPPPPILCYSELHLEVVQLKWTAPQGNFANFVTSYIVYIMSQEQSDWSCHETFTSDVTHANINNLKFGEQYCFKVVAVFDGDQTTASRNMKNSESQPSRWIKIVYPIPSPPENITVNNITQNSVLLKWSKPNVSDEYVKSYKVYKKTRNDGFKFTAAVYEITPEVELEIPGLTPDTIYQFQIQAINADDRWGEAESNIIKTHRKAPGPPGKPYMLRVTHNMVKVTWEKPTKHPEMVYRYQVFYKKYQDPENTEWIHSKKTQSNDTEIEIHELEHSTQYLFLVRPLTEDGYFDNYAASEVSEVVEMKSALPSEPGKPKGETDTSGSITLSWARPEENFKDISHYEINYYQAPKEGHQPQSHSRDITVSMTTDNAEEQLKIESLSPNQGYYFAVRAVTKRGEKSGFSLWSDLITNHKTLAAKVLPFCKYIGEKNDKIPIYLLPPGEEMCSTNSLKIFHNRLTNQSPLTRSPSPSSSRKSQVNKVLMLVGATGAGKSTLINAMMNYIMRVEYGDHFRLKLIHDPDVSQTKSVTKFVTAYTIQYESGFAIPYTLTIIDTPGFGDTAGLKRDREITQQIKEFFSMKDGIAHLDGVGFVCQSSAVRLTHTQRYIFDSIQAIFGNDVKNNIFIFCTFCDGEEPQVIKAVEEANIPTDKHYRFNNSSVYSANSANKVTESFWEMSVESFKKFFEQLEQTEPVGVRRTKDVLQQREYLEIYAIELKQKIQQGMAMISQLNKDTEALTKMKDTQCQEIEVEEDITVNIDLQKGERANNCEKCNQTCHYPCTYEYDFFLKDCNAMKKHGDKMYCSVCPGLCFWKDHKIFTYRKEKKKRVVKKTFRNISAQYFNTMDHETTSINDTIEHLKNEIDEKFEEIFCLLVKAKECNKELDNIALLPNHLNDTEYINLLIEAQKSEKSEGYKERIQQYQLLKDHAAIFKESGQYSLKRNIEGKRWWEKHFDIQGKSTDAPIEDPLLYTIDEQSDQTRKL